MGFTQLCEAFLAIKNVHAFHYSFTFENLFVCFKLIDSLSVMRLAQVLCQRVLPPTRHEQMLGAFLVVSADSGFHSTCEAFLAMKNVHAFHYSFTFENLNNKKEYVDNKP